MARFNQLAALTFVSLPADGSAKSYWQPNRSGDYAADCGTGRDYADELVECFQVIDDPDTKLLGFKLIMESMVAAGRFEAVEIGFCSQLGAAMAAHIK